MAATLDFLDAIYNALPDFSGILLAAFGAAMIFAPSWVDKIALKYRWSIAAVLVGLGVLGMVSSYTQHRDADRAQTALGRKIDDLKQTDNTLQETVNTYGPKLDRIISETDPSEKRADALDLKRRIQADANAPKLDPWMKLQQADFISPLTFDKEGGHIDFSFAYRNVGHGPAYGVFLWPEIYVMKGAGSDPVRERDRFCGDASANRALNAGRILYPGDGDAIPRFGLGISRSDIESAKAAFGGHPMLPMELVVCVLYNVTSAPQDRHYAAYVYQISKRPNIPGTMISTNSDEDVPLGGLVLYQSPIAGEVVH